MSNPVELYGMRFKMSTVSDLYVAKQYLKSYFVYFCLFIYRY